jgi:aspartate aminotransferase-like enzyme
VTPPVSLFYALDLVLEMLLSEGLEAVFARHQHLGEYVRRHVRAIGLQLLTGSTNVSNTVTAIRIPEGIDATVLLNTLRERDRVVLAGGQERLSGKIARIAHMGCCYSARGTGGACAQRQCVCRRRTHHVAAACARTTPSRSHEPGESGQMG